MLRAFVSASCTARKSAIRCDAVRKALPTMSTRVGDAAALGERLHLAVQDLLDRPVDGARGLERVRQLAQVAVEVDEPPVHVVELGDRLLPMRLHDERVQLVAQPVHVAGQRENVLDRPVVEVEAQAS